MSRVRDALKRANEIQPSLKSFEPEPAHAAATTAAEPEDPFDLDEPACGVPSSRRAKYYPLLRHRWIRKLLKLAGVRTSTPVPRCQGTTRMGQPCRGPAMANGFCRLHGGSRRSAVLEKARGVVDRVLPAR